jgi:hypothetical protein
MPNGRKHGRNTTRYYTLHPRVEYSTAKNARAKHLEDEKILVKASVVPSAPGGGDRGVQ